MRRQLGHAGKGLHAGRGPAEAAAGKVWAGRGEKRAHGRMHEVHGLHALMDNPDEGGEGAHWDYMHWHELQQLRVAAAAAAAAALSTPAMMLPPAYPDGLMQNVNLEDPALGGSSMDNSFTGEDSMESAEGSAGAPSLSGTSIAYRSVSLDNIPRSSLSCDSSRLKMQNREAQRRYRARRKEKEQALRHKSELYAKAGEENDYLVTESIALHKKIQALEKENATLRGVTDNSRPEEAVHSAADGTAITNTPSHMSTILEKMRAAILRLCDELAATDVEFRETHPAHMSTSTSPREGHMPTAVDALLDATTSNDGPDAQRASCEGCIKCIAHPCEHVMTPLVLKHDGSPALPAWAVSYTEEQIAAMDQHLKPLVNEIAILRQQVSIQQSIHAPEVTYRATQFQTANATQGPDEISRKWDHIGSVLRVRPEQKQQILHLRKDMETKLAAVWAERSEVYAQAARASTALAATIPDSSRTHMHGLMLGEAKRLHALQGLLVREASLQDDIMQIANVLTPWQSARMVCESMPDLPDFFHLASALERIGRNRPSRPPPLE